MITLKKVTEDGTDHSCEATPESTSKVSYTFCMEDTHEVTDRDLL